MQATSLYVFLNKYWHKWDNVLRMQMRVIYDCPYVPGLLLSERDVSLHITVGFNEIKLFLLMPVRARCQNM